MGGINNWTREHQRMAESQKNLLVEKGGIFAAIRKNEEHEWIDFSIIGSLDFVEIETKKRALTMPQWDKDNRVVRFSQIEIRELSLS